MFFKCCPYYIGFIETKFESSKSNILFYTNFLVIPPPKILFQKTDSYIKLVNVNETTPPLNRLQQHYLKVYNKESSQTTVCNKKNCTLSHE